MLSIFLLYVRNFILRTRFYFILTYIISSVFSFPGSGFWVTKISRY